MFFIHCSVFKSIAQHNQKSDLEIGICCMLYFFKLLDFVRCFVNKILHETLVVILNVYGQVKMISGMKIKRCNILLASPFFWQHGMTPLMHAAYKGKVDMCRLLLRHGADVNCNEHEHGYTALMFAGLSGNFLLNSDH